MANIEEFRASLTAKRDLAMRMAADANESGATRAHAYLRGRGKAFAKALEMLETVEFGDEALPDGWQPAPNLEREVTNGEVQAVLRSRGLSANLYTTEASAVRDELEADQSHRPGYLPPVEHEDGSYWLPRG